MTETELFNERFPSKVEQTLRQAGWFPGRFIHDTELERWYAFRRKQIPGYHQVSPAALAVLREFGGLSIEQDASGITVHRFPFHIDPLKAWGLEEESWIKYEWMIEDSLFPIGIEGEHQDSVLAITPRGRVLSLCGIGTGLYLLGDTFDQALHSLILGLMPLHLHFQNYKYRLEEARRVRTAIDRAHISQE